MKETFKFNSLGDLEAVKDQFPKRRENLLSRTEGISEQTIIPEKIKCPFEMSENELNRAKYYFGEIMNHWLGEISRDPVDARKSERILELSKKYEEQVEKMIVYYACQNDPDRFIGLRALGKLADTDYAIALEEKYGLDHGRLYCAAAIYKMTACKRKIQFLIESQGRGQESQVVQMRRRSHALEIAEHETEGPSYETIQQITSLARELVTTARDLEKFTVTVTHSTSAENYESILEQGIVNGSDGNQYIGNGVYTGMFGTFHKWSSKVIHLQVPLKDMVPEGYYGKVEVAGNILGERIVMKKDPENDRFTVIPERPRWTLDVHYDSQLPDDITIGILDNVLNEDITVIHTGYGKSYALDGDETPIVYGSLAQAFAIDYLILKKDFNSSSEVSDERKVA